MKKYFLLVFVLALSACDGGGGASDTSLEQWKKRALHGSLAASYHLGRLYAKGVAGAEPNHTEALYWLRKAADGGHSDAQYHLGLLYAHGWGTPMNLTEALAWWRTAAQKNHTGALYHLAVATANGMGTQQDTLTAIDLYKRAALMGHDKAQFNLALTFLEDDPSIRNPLAAYALLIVVRDFSHDDALKEKATARATQLEAAFDASHRAVAAAEVERLAATIQRNTKKN